MFWARFAGRTPKDDPGYSGEMRSLVWEYLGVSLEELKQVAGKKEIFPPQPG